MRTSQSNPSSKSFSISLSHLILCYLLLLSLFSFSVVKSQQSDDPEVDPDIAANPSHHPSAIKLSRRGLENAQRAGLAANSLIRPTSIRDLDLSHLALVSTVQGSLIAIDRNDGKVLWNLDPTTQHDNNGNGFEPLVGSSYGERAQHSSFANLIKAASLDQSNGGKDSEALKELRQSGLYLIEPSSQGEIYVLTTDDESASDDDDKGEAGTPRIEKLPLDIPQLVELSPFSFPGDPSRVFVGRKKAKLVEIDLKSGKIGAVFGGEEGVWCGSPSEGGCSDDSEPGNDGSDEPDWAYVGRTDYTVTIHVRSRPHLTQTLRFSTYTPNAADRDVAGIWARAGNHIDGKALLSAPEQGSILCLDTSQASDKQSDRDREKTLWSTQLNGTVAGIFDVVRPSSNLFSSTVREQAGMHSNSKSTRPVIVPHPSLSRQALLSYSESRSSLNENGSESETENEVSEYKPQTYLGIADGHLFVMGSAKFPMVTFASPALAGIEADPSGFDRDEGRRIEGRHQHSNKKCHSYGCWIGSYPAQHDPEDQFSEDYHSGQTQLGIEDGGNRPGLDGGSDREQSNDSDPNSQIPFDQDPNPNPDHESEKKSQSSSRWKLTKSTPVVIFLQLIGILIVLIIGCAIYLGLEEQKRSAEVIGNSIANQVVWVPAIKEDEAGFSNSSNSSDPNSIPDSNSSSGSKSHFLSNNQDPLVVSQSRTTSPWAIPNISYSNVNGSSNTLHRRHQRKPSNPYTNTSKSSTKPQVPPEPRIDPEEAAAAAEAARAKLLAEEEAREKAEKAAAKKRESKRRRRGKRAGAAVQAKAGKENSKLNGEGDEEYDEEEGGNENQSNQAQVDKVKDGVLRKEDREGLSGNHDGSSSLFSNSETINRDLDTEIQGSEKASLSIIPPTPTTAALIDRGWLDPGSANPTNRNPPQEGLSRRNSANPEVDPASLPRKGSSLKLSSEVLGYGSSGTVVFKGTFQGRAVAVKRLLRDFVNVASKEVSLLESADNHPNVIRYFCKELTGSFLFIALELCPASLADVIEKPIEFRELGNKLDPKKALAQITSGLQHLHRLSIVHRDIKPQNILVSFSTGGNLKMLLSDFGLSKRLDGLAQTSFSQTMANPGGTVGWRAPEILRGDVSLDLGEDSESSGVSSENGNVTEKEKGEERRRLTRAVDVFALGCLAYYVLSNGEHPFGSRYEREMNIIRRQIDLSRLDGLGEEGHEAQHLISAMVSADPRQRPSATDVLSHPYFWDSNRRLTFLQDASDRFECMERDPPHPALVALETDYHLVVGPDWFKKVDKVFIEDLGKFRGYDGKSVQDLLRALRNKKHHYQDMAPLLKKVMGSLPDGFLSYFTRRFPLLFLRVYTVISEQPLIRTETQFIPYFTTSEPDH